LQAKETVDFFFRSKIRDERTVRILIVYLRKHFIRLLIAWFAIERKAEIVLDVVVTGIDQGCVRQFRQLAGERLVELVRMTAVVTIAGARVEQRIAAKQRGRIGVRKQANVAHCMPRGVERLQFDGLADLDDVAHSQAAIHSGNFCRRLCVRQ